jgi:UDP-glucuronate decarboxylase
MTRLYDSRKRILVTGGAGFLGSHLCERLLREGHDVLCVDNLFTGTKRNIEHLIGNPAFEFMRHDITFPLYVEVDEIYNLACPASPVHYQHDPVQTTKTSVTAPSTCSASPSASTARSSRPRPARFMATPTSTHSRRIIGAM